MPVLDLISHSRTDKSFTSRRFIVLKVGLLPLLMVIRSVGTLVSTSIVYTGFVVILSRIGLPFLHFQELPTFQHFYSEAEAFLKFRGAMNCWVHKWKPIPVIIPYLAVLLCAKLLAIISTMLLQTLAISFVVLSAKDHEMLICPELFKFETISCRL